ncbi:hypothetical protein Catovirus_1_682 [Catovirus CTV1]|uniref:Uncharacterized protein n=1 Tax=Catovirus CTV1 TaxID=1977631 RepID=A0A1V0SA95_9VIRU|nr:hypothetical protein Catovirus_1_682 [Catovirus CTV1]
MKNKFGLTIQIPKQVPKEKPKELESNPSIIKRRIETPNYIRNRLNYISNLKFDLKSKLIKTGQ